MADKFSNMTDDNIQDEIEVLTAQRDQMELEPTFMQRENDYQSYNYICHNLDELLTEAYARGLI